MVWRVVVVMCHDELGGGGSSLEDYRNGMDVSSVRLRTASFGTVGVARCALIV